MKISNSPKIVFDVIRFFGLLLGTWPMTHYSKYWMCMYDALWWFYLTNDVLVLIPTACAVRNNIKNIVMVTYSWIEMLFIIECIIVLIHSKLAKSSMKILFRVAMAQSFLKKERLLKRYMNLYTFLYILAGISYLVVTLLSLQNSATMDQGLIMTAAYPFKVESLGLMIFLCFNQATFILHSAMIAHYDLYMVSLIYMCTDRLKLLEKALKRTTHYEELAECVKEHQYILNLVRDINSALRLIVLKTVGSFLTFTLASGLQIIHNTQISEWIHQGGIVFIVYLRLFICAECVENMTSACEDIGFTIYSTEWYNESRKIVNAKCLIIQRCQRLPKIYVSGAMPAVNRRYLATILYTTVSYLMTLRTITMCIREA